MKRIVILSLTTVLTFAGCGGGGEKVAGIDRGGTPTPSAGVVSKGAVTGFGSVIVNGVTFDTNNSAFTIDGNAGTQSDLNVGDVIVVQGTLDDGGTAGTADSVTFDDAVEGPISAIDAVAGTLTVLGQSVIVDASTSFDDSISPPSLDGLVVNDVVEVSGFVLADGSISATRIELKPVAGEFEVTGTVSNLAGTTFEINGLVVDFTSAMLEDFPSGTPADGQLVEAKGDSIGGFGELLATRVEFKGTNIADDGDRAEIEGFVTRFVSATDFDVAGIPITTNAQTVYENGTSADLVLNRKVEVEGDINASGVLVADKIEIKATGSIRVESLVDDVQTSQLTVLGIVINVDASTRYEDKSSADLESFNLADVNVGDYVEIRGYENNSGIVAILLEREDFDSEVSLRGFVDSVNDPDFTILGVTVTTDVSTTFRDLVDMPITSAEFFAQANGQLVGVSGTLSGNTIVADEVELED